MGYIDDKVSQIMESKKDEVRPEAIESLKSDAQALSDKADSLESEAAASRQKASDILAEINPSQPEETPAAEVVETPEAQG